MSVNFPLKTDYQDDILDLTQNSQRCFEEIINTDESKSFRDVTAYEREGDNYGASVINVQNEAINELHDDITNVSNELTANSKKFQFAYDNTKDKYGYTIDGTFYPFNSGAIYLGQYSANTTIDVSDLGATSASQFLAICDTSASQRNQSGYIGMIDTSYVYTERSYTPPTLALSGNNLTLTVGSIYSIGGAYGNVHHYQEGSTTLATKVYFVGDIGTR